MDILTVTDLSGYRAADEEIFQACKVSYQLGFRAGMRHAQAMAAAAAVPPLRLVPPDGHAS